MLDDDDSFFGEELFWVVIDELSVDEHIRLELEDLFNLGLHLLLFGFFDFGDLLHGVNLNLSSVDFNFVVVHWGVGNKDLSIFESLLTSGSDILFQDNSINKIGLFQSSSSLLDNMDIIKVSTSLQSLDSFNSQLSKMILILCKELRGKSSLSNVEEILFELFLILGVILGDLIESLESNFSSLSPSSDDVGWVNFHIDKLFSFSE